jgi:ATP-dependent Clp protease ATP-binding subunit ClpC
MLGDEVHEGDRVLARWDGDEQKVSFEPVREAKPAVAKDTSKRGKPGQRKAA